MQEFDKRTPNITELVTPFFEAVRELRLQCPSQGMKIDVLKDTSTENLLAISRKEGRPVFAIETLGECPRLVVKDSGVVLFFDHHPSKEALAGAGIDCNFELNAACVLALQFIERARTNERGFRQQLYTNGEPNVVMVFKDRGIDQDGILTVGNLCMIDAYFNADQRQKLFAATRAEGQIDNNGGSLESLTPAMHGFVRRMGAIFKAYNEHRRLPDLAPEKQIENLFTDLETYQKWIRGEQIEPRVLDTRYEVLAISPHKNAAIVRQIGADARLEWPKEVQGCRFVYWLVSEVSDKELLQLTRASTEIRDDGSMLLSDNYSHLGEENIRLSVQLNPRLHDSALSLYPLFKLLNTLEGLPDETWWGRKGVGGGPAKGTRMRGDVLLGCADAVALRLVPDLEALAA